MGSDPRRLDGLRRDERLAALLVERVTGARARAHDVGGRQGAHDVDLTYPGGRRAALEVTTHAGVGVRHAASVLGQERLSWPNPGRWWWTIDIADMAELPRVRAVYARAIRVCESQGLSTPVDLPDAVVAADPELRWLARTSASTMRGHPSAVSAGDRRPGGVVVGPTVPARSVDSRLTGLPTALSELLTVGHVARRVAKVAAVRKVDERHLFIGIGQGGLPDALYVPLTGPLQELPADAPDIPEGISHIWLTTAWSGAPLVGWDTVQGWRAHHVVDEVSRRQAR